MALSRVSGSWGFSVKRRRKHDLIRAMKTVLALLWLFAGFSLVAADRFALTWTSAGPGASYRVQATKDFSTWVTVANTDKLGITVSNANEELQAFRVVARHVPPQSVTLAWDASLSAGDLEYCLYYGSASRVYSNCVPAGTNLTASVSSLSPGSVYYFAATALDAWGFESEFSAEVSTPIPVFRIAIRRLPALINRPPRIR